MLPAQEKALRRYRKRRPDARQLDWDRIAVAALGYSGGFPRKNDNIATQRGFIHALMQTVDAALLEVR